MLSCKRYYRIFFVYSITYRYRPMRFHSAQPQYTGRKDRKAPSVSSCDASTAAAISSNAASKDSVHIAHLRLLHMLRLQATSIAAEWVVVHDNYDTSTIDQHPAAS